MEAFLSRIYFDPGNPAGLTTLPKIPQAVRKGGRKYTKKAIHDRLLAQDTYSLYSPKRKNFPTRCVLVDNIDHVHQADFTQMMNLAAAIEGINYLLVIIDVFSKYVWVKPLESKVTAVVEKAFEVLYTSESARVPLLLGTDKGTEFTGSRMQKLFQKYEFIITPLETIRRPQ